MPTTAAARRRRFDESPLRDIAVIAGALTLGRLLTLLGRALRAVDHNLADFD